MNEKILTLTVPVHLSDLEFVSTGSEPLLASTHSSSLESEKEEPELELPLSELLDVEPRLDESPDLMIVLETTVLPDPSSSLEVSLSLSSDEEVPSKICKQIKQTIKVILEHCYVYKIM